MSGTQLTIGGSMNAPGGIVTVQSSQPADINSVLQAYLNQLAGSVSSGTVAFENRNLVANTDETVAGSIGGGSFLELTNTDSLGNQTPGSVSGSFVVTPGTTSFTVQAPGDETVIGAAATNTVIFGALSNVNYTVTDGTASSIFASGGSNNINLLSSGATPLNDTVFSSGNDSLFLSGQGSVVANAMNGANDTIGIIDPNTTITASGNATVSIFWGSPNSGGTLDFINNSTTQATIFSSVFANGQTAPNHVTAFGGAGGGYFNGGQAGNNSLVGGTGVVTLVGAGNGDFLEAQSGLGRNDFFAGSGTETLLATASTRDNLFQVGLDYPGVGQPAGNGLISTSGSGAQTYFLGNAGSETIFGSTAATSNVFNVVSDATSGGGNFIINNFVNGTLFLTNAADNGAGSAFITGIGPEQGSPGNALITLSDNTKITLVGVTASNVFTHVDGQGTTFITS